MDRALAYFLTWRTYGTWLPRATSEAPSIDGTTVAAPQWLPPTRPVRRLPPAFLMRTLLS
jgi:hypothetical protein